MQTYKFHSGFNPMDLPRDIMADAFDVSAVGDYVSVSFFRQTGEEMVKHPDLGHEVEARRMEKFSEYQVADGWYVELDRSDILNEAESILKGAVT